MARLVGNWGGGGIWQVTSGHFVSNCYFCETSQAGNGILIDPGLDGSTIDRELNDQGLRPDKVFCTHGHFDHAGSASHFQNKYGCRVYLHSEDERIVRASNFLLMALKIPCRITPAEFTYVGNADTVDVAGTRLTFLGTPGHTPGSCVIEFGNAWFTGDTLYTRGIGLSKLPGENREALRRSLDALWPGLTTERLVLPGHGDYSDGASVRSGNRELREFMGLDFK